MACRWAGTGAEEGVLDLLCGWLPILLVQRRDKKMWRRVLGLELKPLIASVGRRTAGYGGAQGRKLL